MRSIKIANICMLLLPLVQAGHLDAKKGETLKEKTL
jgi:hypothetical protein